MTHNTQEAFELIKKSIIDIDQSSGVDKNAAAQEICDLMKKYGMDDKHADLFKSFVVLYLNNRMQQDQLLEIINDILNKKEGYSDNN